MKFRAVLAPSLVSADGTTGEIVERDLAKKLDLYLTRITRFGFSGALLVAKDGKVILNKGYGIDTAVGAKIGFKMDDKGAVIGLTLPGNKKFIALKEKR